MIDTELTLPRSQRTPAFHAIPALELLVDILSGASSEMDRTDFYSHLAEALCRLAGMRRAVVFRYDDATHSVVAAGSHGVDLARFAQVDISIDSAPEAMRSLAEDRVVEVRPPAVHTIPAEFASLVGEHPLVYVPMAAAGRWPGVIVAEPALEALMQSVLAEAVRNVRKHATASAVLVRVHRVDGLLVLEVENDGVGERARGRPPGMGLRLAALEALQVGGVVEFGERAPGTLAGAARRSGGGPMTGTAELEHPIRVLIVDDHDVVHWGFRLMLSDLAWVQRSLSARSRSEAIELAQRFAPQVALIDLFVGEESGPEICERLHVAAPGIKVLLVSGAGRISSTAVRACGAVGFVPKSWPAADIARAVRMVALGMSIIEPETDSAPAPGPALTDREQDVLKLVAVGATNREIAASLHLSPHTVKEYASALYRKLEARNRTEAVQRAQRLGVLA